MSPLSLAALSLAGLSLAALAACHPASPATAPRAPGGPATQLSDLPLGPATAVVRLTPNLPTAVLAGPFQVTTVNPGGSLAMAIAPDSRCDDAALLWFGYSGGGVSVGTTQILCVRSSASSAATHGFSGSSPARPTSR